MTDKKPQPTQNPPSNKGKPTNDGMKGGHNPNRYERRPSPPVKPPAKGGN